MYKHKKSNGRYKCCNIWFISQAGDTKVSEQNLSRWKRLWLSVSKSTKLRFSHRLGSTGNRSKKTKEQNIKSYHIFINNKRVGLEMVKTFFIYCSLSNYLYKTLTFIIIIKHLIIYQQFNDNLALLLFLTCDLVYQNVEKYKVVI